MPSNRSMMMNKKGYGGVPKILNFIMALIVLAGGALPLLAQFSIIGEIPSIPLLIIQIITIIAGILLLIDGIVGSGTDGNIQVMPRGLNFITAIIVLAGGIIPLLSRFKLIGELPAVPAIVFYGLLVLAGVILLLDGILGAKDTSI